MQGQISVLFVCAGNIFRSVAARHIFEAEIKKLGLEEFFDLHTAGLVARTGQKGEPELNRELKRLGYPPVDHRATELEQEMVEAADLILTAEEEQRAEIVRSVPRAARKTFTLKQMARIGAALKKGIESVPPVGHTGKPSALSLHQHLEHLFTYRGYAHNPDYDTPEDIADPYDTGKHREAAREVRDAIVTIVGWWAK